MPSRDLNPRWMLYALRERGFPVVNQERMGSAVAVMSSEERADLRGIVQRIARGSESNEDVSTITAWVSKLKDAPENLHHEEPAAFPQSDPEPSVAPVSAATDGDSGNASPRRDYDRSHHVYGSKGAFCVEPVEVVVEREGKANETQHTLQIEMASALSRQRYDWDHKIIFRLTQRELPLFAAAMMGVCPSLEFGNHGTSKDKFMQVQDQASEGSLYVSLKQGKRLIGVPIGGDEIFPLIAMGLKVLGKNAPHVDSQTLLFMVKRAGAMYARASGLSI